MKSEVEINSGLICVGDLLHFDDGSGFQKWTVTELFDGGFEAEDDYEKASFYFNQLQYGWSISERTKEKHRIEDRFSYTV